MYNERIGLRRIDRSVLVANGDTIHPLMPVPIPNKCGFHHGNTCTNAKYSDAYETMTRNQVRICKLDSTQIVSRAHAHISNYTYRKRDWISISWPICFSMRPLTTSDLNKTFNATMKCVFFSRATYTRPNFPRPSGQPSSKSSLVHV